VNNFVLKKFVKNLNNVALSDNERAVLRNNFLKLTGLHDLPKQPSLKSSFVLTSPKTQSFELRIVDGCPSETEQDQKEEQRGKTKIQPMKQGVIMKINLNVLDNKDNEQTVTPETFVVIKVAPINKEAF
jgi:hypothetical protein